MITRFRGDSYKQALTLKLNGALVDLDTVSKVEFAFKKIWETIVILCEKDATPLSGKVYIPFTSEQTDTVGEFDYDVQVTWNDTSKTTFEKSIIKFTDDVNKT